MNYYCKQTNIGYITIYESEGKIVRITFEEKQGGSLSDLLNRAFLQLEEYFNGKRFEFDLPLHAIGTEFQKRVWEALTQIPYGETRTYKDIAIVIGNPKACRAVGMANNKNPLGIVVPCHRVIGSNNKLTGYAGGLDIKEKLLQLERASKIQ